MQIYLGLFIPVIFGLLVSFNIIVWSHVRINYIFIFGVSVFPFNSPFHLEVSCPWLPTPTCVNVNFCDALELDVRTAIDSREYAEVSVRSSFGPDEYRD